MADKETPTSWNEPEDARKAAGAGTYPNYDAIKTRSGHTLIFDDSEGAEHITLQHRSGSMLQFDAKGGVKITSSKGQYNIVFGENRIMVTGAQDITVQGDASLRIDGNYNVTCNKDINFNTQNDINFSGRNINTIARGNIDIVGKNRTEKIEGSILQQAHGSQALLSDSNITVGAKTGSIALMAGKMMSLYAKASKLMLKAGENIGIKSAGATSIAADGNISLNSSSNLKLKGSSGTSVASSSTLNLSGSSIIQNTSAPEEPDDANDALALHEGVDTPTIEPENASTSSSYA